MADRSGFSSGGKTWAPEPAVLSDVCGRLSRALGKSHGDRGVASLLTLMGSMPTGVLIAVENLTDSQREALRAVLTRCLHKSPLDAGLRGLAGVIGA